MTRTALRSGCGARSPEIACLLALAGLAAQPEGTRSRAFLHGGHLPLTPFDQATTLPP